MLPMSELVGVLDGVDALVSHMLWKPYRDPLTQYISKGEIPCKRFIERLFMK